MIAVIIPTSSQCSLAVGTHQFGCSSGECVVFLAQ